MLKWHTAALARDAQQPLHFEDTLDLASALMARDSAILAVTPVTVSGTILADDGAFVADVSVRGELTVPSTRSLSPVTLPLAVSFHEVYVTPGADAAKYTENGELVLDVTGDEIDLVAAVEDHILLSIPMQVLTPEEEATGAMPAGAGWQVVSEDDPAASQKDAKPNAAFEQLRGLFSEAREDDDTDDS